jgi:hypothetical protein
MKFNVHDTNDSKYQFEQYQWSQSYVLHIYTQIYEVITTFKCQFLAKLHPYNKSKLPF